MDTRFFASKYFAISLIVALLIVGGAAAGYYAGSRAYGSSQRGCEAPAAASGAELTPKPTTSVENDGERRVVTYALNASSYQGGALDLCVSVGEVYVEPSNSSQITLTFTIAGDHAAAVESTSVKAAVHDVGGKLRLDAWEDQAGIARTGLFDSSSARTRLVLAVPASGAYDIKGIADVGDVRITDLMASSLDLVTNVGNVRTLGVDLTGNAAGQADVGDVTLSLASVQAGNITARTNVGDAEIDAPQRTDVGFAAHAETNVGKITVAIGPTESDTKSNDRPGGSEDARSAGYDVKPTHVVLRAQADVGDVRILAG